MLDLVKTSRQTKPGPDANAQQLADDWFDERDQDEDFKTRIRAARSMLKQIRSYQLAQRTIRMV